MRKLGLRDIEKFAEVEKNLSDPSLLNHLTTWGGRDSSLGCFPLPSAPYHMLPSGSFPQPWWRILPTTCGSSPQCWHPSPWSRSSSSSSLLCSAGRTRMTSSPTLSWTCLSEQRYLEVASSRAGAQACEGSACLFSSGFWGHFRYLRKYPNKPSFWRRPFIYLES